MRIDALRPFADSAAGSKPDDFDSPATGLADASRDGQHFAPVWSVSPIVLEVGEDAILVFHGLPVRLAKAALGRRREAWGSISDSQQ
ncbi:hypothetical protein GXW78_03665 [Roseomonas terrae]|uniref:Uncharacterized protein n=1 Tax=Neoroseomonas terrae TaxID=424799 RepID=A0ABS5ECK3_9PROT|nr:hypothetical protein [Neoroseomonas terrae]MBR0648744.1 hypothetical protein [Neoroseomonas terrae]